LPLVVGCGSLGSTTTMITQPARVASATAPAVAITTTPTQTRSDSTTGGSASTAPITPPTSVVSKPHIIWDPIPFGPERKAQMIAYVRRHYGSFMKPTYRLIDPHVIVIHYTETPTFQATYNTFAPDTPDPELHELPNTCTHFVIDKAGGIHQLVPLDIMCRHTVGLNWTAIGIEHVGYSDQEVLDDHAQVAASLRLVRWLRCRFHIAIRNVIGHNESLSSPYHREDVPALRTQTHLDFNHTDMRVYRRRLAAAGGCS
jgi:N-acetylmuramoyl-L-alanine amidase